MTASIQFTVSTHSTYRSGSEVHASVQGSLKPLSVICRSVVLAFLSRHVELTFYTPCPRLNTNDLQASGTAKVHVYARIGRDEAAPEAVCAPQSKVPGYSPQRLESTSASVDVQGDVCITTKHMFQEVGTFCPSPDARK
jgi:hypothetical protein